MAVGCQCSGKTHHVSYTAWTRDVEVRERSEIVSRVVLFFGSTAEFRVRRFKSPNTILCNSWTTSSQASKLVCSFWRTTNSAWEVTHKKTNADDQGSTAHGKRAAVRDPSSHAENRWKGIKTIQSFHWQKAVLLWHQRISDRKSTQSNVSLEPEKEGRI